MSELAGRRVEGIVARVAKLVLSYLSSPVLAALRCERDVLQHQRAVILCGHPWDGSGRSLRLSKAWVPSPSASKKAGRSAAHGASAKAHRLHQVPTWLGEGQCGRFWWALVAKKTHGVCEARSKGARFKAIDSRVLQA